MMYSVEIFRSLFRCYRMVTRISSRSISFNASYKMKELINARRYKEALDLFDHPSQVSNDFSLSLALKACTKLGLKQRGIQIHQGLSSKSLENPFIQATLVHFYMQCKHVDRAEEIFSVTHRNSPVSISAMMKGYVSNGMPSKALQLFERLSIKPDQVTLTILFNACAKAADAQAKQIGRNFLGPFADENLDDEKLINSAIDMFMRFGDIDHAERLFGGMKKRWIATYGAMMRGYVINHRSEKALDLFENLPMEPDQMAYAIVYSACASLCNDRAARLAKKCLGHMPKIFLDDILLIGSTLRMLMKFGEVEEATRLFSRIKKSDVNIYGIMLNGYNLNDEPTRSLQLFERLQKEQKIIIDEPIAVALVSACSKIAVRPICERFVKFLPTHLVNNNRRVRNALIDMWVRISSSVIVRFCCFDLRGKRVPSIKRRRFSIPSLIPMLLLILRWVNIWLRWCYRCDISMKILSSQCLWTKWNGLWSDRSISKDARESTKFHHTRLRPQCLFSCGSRWSSSIDF